MAKKLGPVISGDASLTQSFGKNPDFYKPFGFNGHEGIDLAAAAGTIVAAAHSGRVVYAGNTGGAYGNAVIIFDSIDHVMSLYAHLERVEVEGPTEKKITVVREGDMLGRVGSTGRSTGNHLHFSIARTNPNSLVNLRMGGESFFLEGKLNPDNGYKGWEDPFDKNIFDWWPIWLPSLKAPRADQWIDGEVGDGSVNGQPVTFDEIFAKYYIGWDRTAAEADFTQTYGGDLGKLLVARGIKPEDVVSGGDPETPIVDQAHWIKPEHAGKTLRQIQKDTGEAARLDILGNFIGLDERTIIERNAQFSPTGFPPGEVPDSSEWKFFKKMFTTEAPIFPTVVTLPAAPETTPEPPETEEVPESAQGPQSPEEAPGEPDEEPETPPGAPPPSEAHDTIIQNTFEIIQELENLVELVAGLNLAGPTKEPLEEEGTAGLTIRSQPERAGIYIDDVFQEDYTPSNKPHKLTPGFHDIELKLKGYKDFKRPVFMLEGEDRKMFFFLFPK